MIVYTVDEEGGCFKREMWPNRKPLKIARRLKKARAKTIVFFKNGIIYDGFLLDRGKECLRHKYNHGKSRARDRYKDITNRKLYEYTETN